MKKWRQHISHPFFFWFGVHVFLHALGVSFWRSQLLVNSLHGMARSFLAQTITVVSLSVTLSVVTKKSCTNFSPVFQTTRNLAYRYLFHGLIYFLYKSPCQRTIAVRMFDWPWEHPCFWFWASHSLQYIKMLWGKMGEKSLHKPLFASS